MHLPYSNKLAVCSSVTMAHPPSIPAPFSSDFSVLQKVIQHTFQTPRLTIQQIEELPNHLHRIRLVRLSNGSRLVLKLAPSLSTSLLRHERQCLDTEALTLSLLAKSGLPTPRVLKHDSQAASLHAPFLLTTYLYGTSFAEVRPYLSRADRLGIERQLRVLSSAISQHKSTTFGPVSLVWTGRGHKRWREAFLSMMESALRDGEDMLVSLPYSQIREQVAKAERALDEVEDARLVVPALRNPSNLLIDGRTKEITGLLDFGMALWGDVEMGEGNDAGGTRGLLWVTRDRCTLERAF